MNRNPYNKGGYGGGYHSHHNEPEAKSLVEGKVDKILNLQDESVEEFIKTAEDCAKKFKGISSSKVRDFYDYVKSIEKYNKVKLHLLKPKIAYAVGRADKKDNKYSLQCFQKTMEDLINKTNDDKQFNNFKKFFEAIIAYHKIHGVKQKWN